MRGDTMKNSKADGVVPREDWVKIIYPDKNEKKKAIKRGIKKIK
jgi:hypothetical protein